MEVEGIKIFPFACSCVPIMAEEAHIRLSFSLSCRLMCGIIARSAGLFQNTKKVCTCDGVTIWDEAASQQQQKQKGHL